MTDEQMVVLRRSGVKVKDIVAQSGANERHVYDVMKRAGLATHTSGPKRYVATVTRVEVFELEAYSKDNAHAVAMARYPDAIRASVEIDRAPA